MLHLTFNIFSLCLQTYVLGTNGGNTPFSCSSNDWTTVHSLCEESCIAGIVIQLGLLKKNGSYMACQIFEIGHSFRLRGRHGARCPFYINFYFCDHKESLCWLIWQQNGGGSSYLGKKWFSKKGEKVKHARKQYFFLLFYQIEIQIKLRNKSVIF